MSMFEVRLAFGELFAALPKFELLMRVILKERFLDPDKENNMNERVKPQNPELISCERCLKEIPRSVAKSAEADSYTAYFCGLECYSEWSAQAENTGREEHKERGR
jgi:hypothetical protein